MPRRKFIDKKTATTFALVHRAQNDPLIDDPDAPSMVFAERQQPHRQTEDDDVLSSAGSATSGTSQRSHKIKHRGDLEDEFGVSFGKHEGEAAQHGVFYDDTKYDYMQHMRDLGREGATVTWVAAKTAENSHRGKQRLEDALRTMDLDDARSFGKSSATSSIARSLLPEEVLPSEFVRKRTYQDQQDVPDAIAGFQPDMDPRLREVLEALEDEAYVEDDDIFAELTEDGYEVDKDEWERLGDQQVFDDEDNDDDDDAGWESDDTVKARESRTTAVMPFSAAVIARYEQGTAEAPADVQAQLPVDPTEGLWLDEYKKFKTSQAGTGLGANPVNNQKHHDAPSTLGSSVLSSLANGRRRKRKGAKTSTTNYSMTSSSLARTDQHTLLDDRFDRMEESYALAEFPDEDELPDHASIASGRSAASRSSRISTYSTLSQVSGASGISSYSRTSDAEAPQLVRSDFDGIMNEFLGAHSKVGKTGGRVKRGGPQTGMQQLDEIRSNLGPARLKSRPNIGRIS